MTQLTIGITFRDGPLNQTIFSNGINQNVIFLYEVLSQGGHTVYFIKNEDEPNNVLGINGRTYQTRTLKHVVNTKVHIDLFIEAAVVNTPEVRKIIRETTGSRIVTAQLGHAMIHDMERMFYPMEQKDPVRITKPDVVWASPHFEDSFSYLEMLFSSEVRTAPFIWEPLFVGKPYTTNDYVETPNINVMEANISLLKNALIPITIGERICREHPERFKQMYINGSMDLAKNAYFKANILPNMRWLAAHNQKILFGPRRSFEKSFFQRDVLLSHQNGCELNYLYLEALHKNVPLVHNSPRFKEVGYYYEGFDTRQGADAYYRAAQDRDIDNYHRKGRKFVSQFSTRDAGNIAQYQALVEDAMSRPQRTDY
ncbi:MAG: DUF2827 family protein [Pseudomonadales bacterium]